MTMMQYFITENCLYLSFIYWEVEMKLSHWGGELWNKSTLAHTELTWRHFFFFVTPEVTALALWRFDWLIKVHSMKLILTLHHNNNILWTLFRRPKRGAATSGHGVSSKNLLCELPKKLFLKGIENSVVLSSCSQQSTSTASKPVVRKLLLHFIKKNIL